MTEKRMMSSGDLPLLPCDFTWQQENAFTFRCRDGAEARGVGQRTVGELCELPPERRLLRFGQLVQWTAPGVSENNGRGCLPYSQAGSAIRHG